MELPLYLPLMMMVVILLSLLCSADGKLEILRNDSPTQALLGQNGTLPCHFSGYEASPLDLRTVSVKWTLKTSKGDKPVYWFRSGNLIQNRSGSYIPEDNLLRGDGSLYIPNVQLSDDGEYTCTVIVTPDQATSTVTVQVSVRPECAVSDSRLEMTPNMEKSVTCYVNGFYPKEVEIRWLKHSKAAFSKSSMDNQTCRGILVQNQDGTYDTTSMRSVRPVSTAEDGDVYSCVVTHRSLEHGLTCDVTLSVTLSVGYNSTSLKLIIGIVTSFAILFLIGLLYYCCKKEQPTVWEITKENLIQGEESILSCHISGFRPKNLTLKLYLKGEPVDSWYSEKPRRILEDEGMEQGTPFQTTDTSRILWLDADIISKKIVFDCVCSIHIRPDVKLHDGAILTLEVHHAALKKPICKDKTLKVQYLRRNNSL